MHLDIDISFSVAATDDQGAEAAPIQGRITAHGRHIEVRSDDAESLGADKSLFMGFAEIWADALAEQGLTLSVVGSRGEIVRLGSVKTPVAQRMVTRSRNMRLGGLKALSPFLSLRRARNDGFTSLIPPTTPWPLAPTFNRRIHRRVTTTHYTRGSGGSRLILVRSDGAGAARPPMEFYLERDHLVIGSEESSDLQLPDIDPVHAEIHHDEHDEYVLISHGAVGGSVSAESGSRMVLRTGARFELGPWRLVFIRAEHADHGRPFGGRQGGEFSYQRPQHNPYTGGRHVGGPT